QWTCYPSPWPSSTSVPAFRVAKPPLESRPGVAIVAHVGERPHRNGHRAALPRCGLVFLFGYELSPNLDRQLHSFEKERVGVVCLLHAINRWASNELLCDFWRRGHDPSWRNDSSLVKIRVAPLSRGAVRRRDRAVQQTVAVMLMELKPE